MSHFTVLVIGDDVDEQLEKYNEASEDKSLLVFTSEEAEERENYEKGTREMIVLADGTLKSPHDDIFRVSQGFNNRYEYPHDSKKEHRLFKELYASFEDYMEKYNGRDSRDEDMREYGYWSNPNAKWDWYTVGGRWTGFFKPKAGAMGELGQSGAFGNQPKDGWVDSIRLADIDFDAMKEQAKEEANKTYDELESVLKGRALPSWNTIREKHGKGNIDNARAEYNNLEVVKDLNQARFFVMGDYVESFGNSREEYVKKCMNNVAVPYAIVKDGQWYQKGEMGWFGMSSDEMTQGEWNEQFWKLLSELDGDTMLTLIDCHI